ncbi:diguanylate cyclase [Aminobacter sp. AP02]|uniref:diguanylate cyclase domain-containing protein n=1 Tax=Aminobacter sp. AP02 TaxID=2135737 RepID=UPI000D79BEA5|nr:diguanylate cyclase [Aminobacter sp. AP02]PWK71727.1 PAS domain S-box-containing protein/diguanylate cyclase (GGDEF)-like protein [Aminobacter sp. AP02]
MVTEAKLGVQRGLNSYLLALALVCLLPVIAVSAFAVWHTGYAYMDTATTRLNDTASTLANAIEGELQGRFSTMEVLASSFGQSHGNPIPLSETGFGKIGLDGEIALVDTQSMHLLRSRTPVAAGTALTALQNQSPLVSNIVIRDNRPILSLALPIPGREAAFVLTTSPSSLVQTLLRGKRSLSGILVAVTDGNGRIVARSRDPERFVGQMAPDWSKLQALGTTSGLFEARTVEGLPVMLSYQKLQGTPGWVVVVGEPTSVFNARWRDPIMGLLVGATVAIGLALSLALWLGRRILHPVKALVAHSNAIADGKRSDTASVPPSSIREFEMLRQSFEKAEKALRNEKRRYRVIAEAGAIVLWRRSLADGVGSATGWEQLTGRPAGEVAGYDWAEGIHPEDRALTTAAWRRALADNTPLDVEFRLKVRGDYWLWVRSQGTPMADDDGNIVEWVGVLEDIDARKNDQARIAHMAHHDALTGLGNRTMFRQRLELAASEAAHGAQGALLCLDLDRFKQVNDTLGHPVGDALLCEVAARLRSCASGTDCIARVGGDEFSIIQTNADQPEAAASLGSRLVEILCEPYHIDGRSIIIGASVGITLLGGESQDIRTYLKRADQALYKAKELGRGRIAFYEQDVLLADMARLVERNKEADGSALGAARMSR